MTLTFLLAFSNDYDRQRISRRTYRVLYSLAWRDYHKLQPKPNSNGNHDVAATSIKQLQERTQVRDPPTPENFDPMTHTHLRPYGR